MNGCGDLAEPTAFAALADRAGPVFPENQARAWNASFSSDPANLACRCMSASPRSEPEAGRDRRKARRGGRTSVIQAAKTWELRIVRSEITDHERAAIKPMLPDNRAA